METTRSYVHLCDWILVSCSCSHGLCVVCECEYECCTRICVCMRESVRVCVCVCAYRCSFAMILNGGFTKATTRTTTTTMTITMEFKRGGKSLVMARPFWKTLFIYVCMYVCACVCYFLIFGFWTEFSLSEELHLWGWMRMHKCHVFGIDTEPMSVWV